MSLVTFPTATVPSPSPSPSPEPHRRLYAHRTNTPTISINNLPLMLLPRARLRQDNHDHLHHRAYSVVPDDGSDKLYISAISGTSGWIGEREEGGSIGGGGGGRGMLGGSGTRPVTAFNVKARLRRKEVMDLLAERRKEWGLEDPRPSTSHPLTTRRGKMALLRQRSNKRHRLSARSASADSGLGSPSTPDKTLHDVSDSDVFDDATRFGSNESIVTGHRTTITQGVFGVYINKHSIANEDSHSGGSTTRGAALPGNAAPSDADSGLTADDVFPEYLDSFADANENVEGRLRKRKKRKEEGKEDVFDDRWHFAHQDDDDCPYCREFARATRRRVDRYFGGAESFLRWIFSKWGKRKELEGSLRRNLGVRGRSPHFCNFVHKLDLHARLDTSHARTFTGSDGDDRADSMLSDPTDHDILAQWRKQSRLTGSGTEGRPASPNSVDGRRVTDRNAGVTGSDDDDKLSAKPKVRITVSKKSSPSPSTNVSLVVNHFVNSEGESTLRQDFMAMDEDQTQDKPEGRRTRTCSGRKSSLGKSSKPSTKPRAVKTFITRPPPVPRAKMIPTITIPSSPIPTTDQTASHRSSGESSPRKSAREDPKLTSATPEDKSPERTPSTVRIVTPQDKDKPEKGKRHPLAKKTKKSSDKRRKSKTAGMEQALADSPASGDPQASGDAQPAANDLDVNAKVPDLPGVSPSGKSHGKQSKKDRRLMSPPPEKLQLPPELLELDNSPRNGYDFGDTDTAFVENLNNKYRVQSWLNSRMALSQQSSRFELPMDMKVLETLTPQEYLKKFCIVTSRRLHLYQKIFVKHKDKSNNINKKGLEQCLKETLVQTLKENTFSDLCELLEITDDTVVDFKLFSGVAAITERILYPCYTTEDTVEKPEYQRQRIETADFGALDWKLHGIKIGDKMKKLLKTIE